MAALGGTTGVVTAASHYVTLLDSWRLTITANQHDITPQAPTGNARQFSTLHGVKNGEGSYTCRLDVKTTTTLTLANFYGVALTNPEEFTMRLVGESRDITPLGATWGERVGTVYGGTVEIVCHVDDTAVLPLDGTAGNVVITLDTGSTFTAAVCFEGSGVDLGIDDDGMHKVRLTARITGAVTPATVTTLMPLISASAKLEVEAGGPYYEGTIITQNVTIQANRATGQGSIEVTFVTSGAITNAV